MPYTHCIYFLLFTRQYRRECLFAVGADLGAELDYMDSFSEDNPKNYQIWHHRRVIAEHSREGQREMAFTTTVFGVDAKNYHGWAHRWVRPTLSTLLTLF